MRKLLALPLAVPALAACNEPPYAKVDHVTIAEIEASSVVAAAGVELHVRMITEGDFIERCASNLGGTYHSVIGGEAHVCVVPAP